jgi:hypothetical protein
MKLDGDSIDEHRAVAPVGRRAGLELVEARVLSLSPGAKATFQRGMPFYTLAERPYVAVASQRHHLSRAVMTPEATGYSSSSLSARRTPQLDFTRPSSA